ncbi:MAG TPA: septation protein A [Thermohalobaculum sp.]|nr:septation protein A [Thermohalobaculum sp.]
MTQPQPAPQAAQPRPLVKFALEVGPLLLFFLTFRYGRELLEVPAIHGLLAPVTGAAALAGQGGPLFLATAAFMAAILASLGVSWRLTRRLPRMAVFTAIIVAVFGGLTLWLQDEIFIKMKPTIVSLVFAAILGLGLLRGRSHLKDLMGETMPLDDAGWLIFTRRWVIFFLAMAVLNELVWRSQPTETWVAFKTFAYLPLTFLFLIFQYPLLKRHATEEG